MMNKLHGIAGLKNLLQSIKQSSNGVALANGQIEDQKTVSKANETHCYRWGIMLSTVAQLQEFSTKE